MNPGATLHNYGVFNYLGFARRGTLSAEVSPKRRCSVRTTSGTLGVAVFLLGVMVSSSGLARQNGKFVARRINMPVELRLCEHLEDAILYENDLPTSAMPAERTFQFTYYPDLGVLLPEPVRVEVAGKYKEDGEPFVTRLAVTIDDSAGTLEQAKKSPKLDIRLEPKSIVFACDRYCKRPASVTHTATQP